MKNLKYTIPLLLLCYACETTQEPQISQREVPSKEAIQSAPFLEQVDYAEYYLDVIGKAAIIMHSDERFRQLLYSELDADTYADKNVLIETLLKRAEGNGWDLSAEINTELATRGYSLTVEQCLDAFKGLDGQDWHPQIYVPNYNTLKEQGLIGQVTGNTRPAYVAYGGNEEKSEYSAKWLENEQFIQAFVADETSSDERPVFVISLSEDPKNIPALDPEGTAQRIIQPKFQRMTVKERHESWPAGSSDITFKGISLWETPYSINPNMPGNKVEKKVVEPYFEPDYTDGGYLIRKFSKDEVKKKKEKTYLNFMHIVNWNPYYTNANGDILSQGQTPGDVCWYIIYEVDPWPAATRSARYEIHSTNKVEMSYRSTDGYYVFESHSANSYSQIYYVNKITSTGGIEFQTGN